MRNFSDFIEMQIFFISTWPCDSGLSQATVLPHLEHLANDGRVDKIVYFSIEGLTSKRFVESTGKVEHIPLQIKTQDVSLFHKALAYRAVGRQIINKVTEVTPDLVICRGAPAGIYGYRIKQRFGIPYYVESFEPHADYMRYSGTWSRFGLKYFTQRRWEEAIKVTANGLITVSEAYARHLVVVERLPEQKIYTIPCWADTDEFRFDPDERFSIREVLGIDNRLVCVYVGKFGGLYHDVSILRALQHVREGLDNRLFVMVLTNADRRQVLNTLGETGFTEKDSYVDFVPHGRVFAYLSAADIGISFVKTTPCSFACSPIKNSEYLACGLPFISPPGVGDEADWLEEERAGVTADLTNPSSLTIAARQLKEIVSEQNTRQRIRRVAIERRGKATMTKIYDEIIKSI